MTTTIDLSPRELADEAVRAVLQTQWDGIGALRLDSPPGAGKTGVVERLAAQSLALQGERCLIATQTNEQAFDLARRLGRRYQTLSFHLFARAGLPIPPDVLGLPNVVVVHHVGDFPTGPGVVIANAAKWSWVDRIDRFDLLIVDEAFQLADHRFHQISGLGRRIVLIGDPGQIAPIVTCEIERWKGDLAGPHVAAPKALAARAAGIQRMALPISRRLVPDTVELVQPAFYPDLPFHALAARGERGLVLPGAGGLAIDRPLDLVAEGASLVQVELPARVTGQADPEAAETIVALIERLFTRGAQIRDGDEERPIEPGSVGVVCAHVTQVNAVRERLPQGMGEVLVETSDRFQGLERPVMLVHHPLSGRADASAFHLDAGRLCVMLSRHRVVCLAVTRAGIDEMLNRYAPSGARVLGIDEDPEFQGWRAHRQLQGTLREAGRVMRLG